MKRTFHARPFTQDGLAIKEAYVDNVYDVEPMTASDVVIDIGSHLGAFAVKCLDAGAGMVVCYEPEADNFRLLKKNYAMAGGDAADDARLRNRAIWHPLLGPAKLVHMGDYTAMHSMSSAGKVDVATDTLESVLAEFTDVALLKLDCEGAEWPGLYLTPMEELRKCRRIEAELHLRHITQGLDCTASGICQALRLCGFDVVIKPGHNEYVAMLSARRRAAKNAVA
jgi:FkbM family methyltransferase